MVLRERVKAKLERAKPVTKPTDPDALAKALKVVADAKEVSHPGSKAVAKRSLGSMMTTARLSYDQIRGGELSGLEDAVAAELFVGL